MAREKYNREKEHTVVGTYPPIMGMELGGAADSTGVCIVPETPRFYRPIDTRRNFRMLFEGKKPYWIPNNGWFGCDVNEFRPRQNPDNFANHQCIDGGPYIDYKTVDRHQVSWFQYVMVWEPLSMGATTYPGNPTLDDINDWEEKVQFPNLDDINWEEMREMNKTYLDHDKVNQLGIQMGMWERLMCLMDVSNAAMALVDEDQEEAMHAFLDKLSDFYVEYIRRVHAVCPLDSVMFHDDWGTHNGPFFSLETARKFFVGPMKKITDFCHANDIIFEHHSCGCAQALVPAMIEEGDDFWFPQAAINDLDMLVEKYKDEKRFCISVSSPVLPKGSTPEEVYEIARKWVDKYKDRRILMCQDVSITDPNHDPSLYPIFADAVYECSRIAFQDVEGQD